MSTTEDVHSHLSGLIHSLRGQLNIVDLYIRDNAGSQWYTDVAKAEIIAAVKKTEVHSKTCVVCTSWDGSFAPIPVDNVTV